MTRQARPDLRERMQRVAAKPAQHPDTPRRTRGATSRTATSRSAKTHAETAPSAASRTATPRGGTSPGARSRRGTSRGTPAATLPAAIDADVDVELDGEEPLEAEATSTSRFGTFTGWLVWEVVSVPRTRLRYLKEFVLGA